MLLSRMATFPVGLGDNTIRVLVTDGDGPEPVVMATYTVYLHRENRPSLPMFGEHTMCSFLQVSPGSRPEADLKRFSDRTRVSEWIQGPLLVLLVRLPVLDRCSSGGLVWEWLSHGSGGHVTR